MNCILKTARLAIGASLASAVSILSIEVASAQQYPSRNITLVVPFAPGGLSDVPGRLLANELQQRSGVSVIVENKPGASGVTGASHVLKSEPDGYTLLVNALADGQNLHYINVPYSAVNDFALIGLIADGPPLVLIASNKSGYKSVAQIIADAKSDPKKVSFGSSGPATSPAIAITQLNALAKTQIADVPYRGSGAAAQAVVSGEVQGSFVFMANALQFHEAKSAVAIAVAQPKRFPRWPDLPTMAEQGFPGFDHAGWVGLAAPGKTPPAVIAYLNKQVNDIIASPGYRQKIEALGMTLPDTKENTPEKFKAFMVSQTAKQAELAKLSGHRK